MIHLKFVFHRSLKVFVSAYKKKHILWCDLVAMVSIFMKLSMGTRKSSELIIVLSHNALMKTFNVLEVAREFIGHIKIHVVFIFILLALMYLCYLKLS